MCNLYPKNRGLFHNNTCYVNSVFIVKSIDWGYAKIKSNCRRSISSFSPSWIFPNRPICLRSLLELPVFVSKGDPVCFCTSFPSRMLHLPSWSVKPSSLKVSPFSKSVQGMIGKEDHIRCPLITCAIPKQGRVARHLDYIPVPLKSGHIRWLRKRRIQGIYRTIPPYCRKLYRQPRSIRYLRTNMDFPQRRLHAAMPRPSTAALINRFLIVLRIFRPLCGISSLLCHDL